LIGRGRLLLTVMLTLWLAPCVGRSGALIEFANVTQYAKPAQLFGYLARPDGSDRSPGVIILHGCQGFSSSTAGVADSLKNLGYVGLAVDSLGPRGIADACGQLFIDQALDAYAALKFLSQQPFVDRSRIALLGRSMGGSSALMAVERGAIERRFPERFAAAIAYYPSCRGYSPTLIVPTMILIGEADDSNPAEACRGMTALPHREGARLDLTVYPGAYHAFDVREFQPGMHVRGHWFEYNEPAATDAWEKVRAFLAVHLRDAAADLPQSR
jgi:dienelactone hydrolase